MLRLILPLIALIAFGDTSQAQSFDDARSALQRLKETILTSPSIIARQLFNQASSRIKTSPSSSTTAASPITTRKTTTAPLKIRPGHTFESEGFGFLLSPWAHIF